jgi:SAM-dependent methyltransferase
MTLSDCLSCPDCQGRLTSDVVEQLVCSVCEREFAIVDGVADLVGDRVASGTGGYQGITQEHEFLAADLPTRIKSAAGSLWPANLGDTIEIGCGLGEIGCGLGGLGPMTQAILTGEAVRSLLVVDTDPAVLRACRARVADAMGDAPVWFAALGGGLTAIRDAVADTVAGITVLAETADIRAFLTQVHRMLKTRGRAVFIVPNRRYHQAVCVAIAEALAQRFTLAGAWPAASGPVFAMLGEGRRLLVHRGDPGFPSSIGRHQLFDGDALKVLGREVGFDSVEVLPLDPDPTGGQTITRLCQDAGASAEYAQEFGPLAATVGRPYLGLLDEKDASAFSLVWLTKAAGPVVRVFTDRPTGPPMAYIGADAAIGGLVPRWSIELLGRDTPDGVVVTIGGWCLANIDTLWVRLTLGSAVRQAAVWHPRPDVHEVLNRTCIYHPLHALCSGLRDELLFPDVHPGEEGCPLRLEIILAGGLAVTGPAPEWLMMDQPTVIAH